MFEIKGDNDPFDSLEEFIDNLNRGGEIEFVYKGNKYSITHPEGELSFAQAGIESSEKIFENIDELLEHEIQGQKIRNIVTEIKPYFRCF